MAFRWYFFFVSFARIVADGLFVFDGFGELPCGFGGVRSEAGNSTWAGIKNSLEYISKAKITEHTVLNSKHFVN